jgi:hypothetical protein
MSVRILEGDALTVLKTLPDQSVQMCVTSPPFETKLIETLAYNLYGATLVGNPAPIVKELGDRMIAYQVGDLVLECSTIYMDDRYGARLGKLARVAIEPMFTPERWYQEMEAGPEEKIPEEKVWYLALPDGREFRWTNARFIAVPTSLIGYPFQFTSDPSKAGI